MVSINRLDSASVKTVTVTGPDTVWLTAVPGLIAVPLISAALTLYPETAEAVTESRSK